MQILNHAISILKPTETETKSKDMNFAMHFSRSIAYSFDFAHVSSLGNNTIIE